MGAGRTGQTHTLEPGRKGWPDREIHLFGPDAESGTFDFFTAAIVGETKRSRTDYTANTDDAVLAQAVADDPDALGYFGYTYFAERREALKAAAGHLDESLSDFDRATPLHTSLCSAATQRDCSWTNGLDGPSVREECEGYAVARRCPVLAVVGVCARTAGAAD